jgi:hypothetical protein
MKSAMIITLVLSAAAFAGCNKGGNPVSRDSGVASADAGPNDAIRRAIQVHLAHNGNLNLNSFDTEIKQVTFSGDHAQAHVKFRAKNGPGAMQLTYALAKRDGSWSVVESAPGGSNFSHPALDKTQAPAEGGGTMGGDSAIFSALDNFHRVTATPPQNLPLGHSRVVASPKDTKPELP